MPRMVALLVLLTVLLASVLTASVSAAHPGGRAADGCHFCRTNCAQWGEVAGERHCHEERPPSRVRQNGQPPIRQPHAAAARPTRRRPAAAQAPWRSWAACPGSSMPIRLKWRGRRCGFRALMPPNLRNPAGRRAANATSAGTTPLRRSGRGSGPGCSHLHDRGPGPLPKRALGICYAADGTDLNGWLVSQGHALAYRRYSTKYVPQEDQAQGGSGRSLGGRVYQAVGLAAWGTAGLKLTHQSLSDAVARAAALAF